MTSAVGESPAKREAKLRLDVRAEAMGKAFGDVIWLPHAILVQNQVIQFFDETIHDVVEDEASEGKLDPRWIACRRPVVKAGGELRLDMLDLIFEPTSRTVDTLMRLQLPSGVDIEIKR